MVNIDFDSFTIIGGLLYEKFTNEKPTQCIHARKKVLIV